MKKISVIIAIFICIVSVAMFSSCKLINWLTDDWLTKNQKDIINEAMSRLCDAIERRDHSAVKSEFSLYDISEVENFDESIEKLFNYIEGENIKFTFVSSGSESASMGGYPREREFGGTQYTIETSTDSYKVVLSYRSHYSTAYDKIIKERIGFTHFDIINVKNDRECENRFYSGCPFYYKGINFDYKTTYIFCPEEYGMNIATSERLNDFDPIIINSAKGLEDFYNQNLEEYDLEPRTDKTGYKDIIGKDDDAFFETHSLYMFGNFEENNQYSYVPQFVYIGDFVLVDVAMFRYNGDGSDFGDAYFEKGIIMIIELPEKVSDEIPTLLQLYIGRE